MGDLNGLFYQRKRKTMKIINSEQLICADVDDTVIIWSDPVTIENEANLVQFYDPYEKCTKWVLSHPAHIKIIKDRKARGATIILWSQSGYEWAVQAAKACGLLEHVDYCASKPVAIIDDKPASAWLQERIFLPSNTKYGISAAKEKVTIDNITTFNIG